MRGGNNRLSVDELRRRILHGQKRRTDSCWTVHLDTVETLGGEAAITCELHGDFTLKVKSLIGGAGCPTCGAHKPRKYNTDAFIRVASRVHAGKYSYEKSSYEHITTKICITCPSHGEFWQTPANHMGGHGCPSCGRAEGATTQHLNGRKNVKSIRTVEVKGKEFIVDSRAEQAALNYLATKISVGRIYSRIQVPMIEYRVNGHSHRHYADFYIPSRELLIEVKTMTTMGLTEFAFPSKHDPYLTMRRKARDAFRAGYTYLVLLVMNSAGHSPVVELPLNWYKRFHRPTSLKKYLKKHLKEKRHAAIRS